MLKYQVSMFRVLFIFLYFTSACIAQEPVLLENSMDIILFTESEGNYKMVKVNKDTTLLVNLDSIDIGQLVQFKGEILNRKDTIDMLAPYTLTLRKLEPLQNHLIIVTEGIFENFPFPAMTKNKPLGHENLTQHDYLINYHTITYQKSIAKWEEMTEQSVNNEEMVILVKDKEDEQHELLKEAKYIRDDFGGRLVTFNDSDWLELMNSARLLHLNAEGKYDRSLYVNGREVESSAELVSLSLLDRPLESDEIVNTLSTSKAKAVLYSVWPIKEKSRRLILNEFYKNLFDGERKNDALQKSIKRYLTKTTEVQLAHPYYWAGWRLYGDIKSVNNIVNPLLYLVIIVLFIVFYYLIKRAKVKMY